MEAEISNIKKVGNDLELILRPLSNISKHVGTSLPNHIYISKFTHRPQVAQRIRSTGERITIESRKGMAFNREYVRVTGHHLTYQEDFTSSPTQAAEAELSNQQMDDDGGKIA